jgi:Periplasmic protease
MTGKRRLFRGARALLTVLAALLVTATTLRAEPQPGAPVPGRPATEPGRTYVLPFDFAPPARPLVVVRASLNGSEPLPFIVDTGVNRTLTLARWAASEAGDRSEGKTFRVREASEPCVLRLVTEGSSGADGLRLNIAPAYVAESALPFEDYPTPGRAPGRIAGIIGVTLFGAAAAEFDFDQHTLTLHVGGGPPPPRAAENGDKEPRGVSLALVPVAGTKMPFLSAVPGEGAAAVPLLVDTGSTATVLPAKSLRAARGDRGHVLSSAETGFTTVAGSANRRAYLLDYLPLRGAADTSVDSSTSVRVPLLTVLEGPDEEEGVLGLDVLARFRLWLDLPRGKIILYPRAAAFPVINGDAGVTLGRRNAERSYYAGAFSKDSLAEAAGLRAGDTLVSVDGTRLDDLPPWAAYRVLDGVAGTVARLTVQPSGKEPREVRFVRPGLFPNVLPLPDAGLVLVQEVTGTAAGSIRVVYVLPSSPAARAGVSAGAQLRKVDERTLTSVTPDEWRRIIEAAGGRSRLVFVSETGEEVTLTQRQD